MSRAPSHHQPDYMSKADEEFRNAMVTLFIVMFGAIILIGVIIGHNASKRAADLANRGCVLQNRIFVEQQYCGKACMQDVYLHEYQCITGREVYTGPVEHMVNALHRDDYFSKPER